MPTLGYRRGQATGASKKEALRFLAVCFTRKNQQAHKKRCKQTRRWKAENMAMRQQSARTFGNHGSLRAPACAAVRVLIDAAFNTICQDARSTQPWTALRSRRPYIGILSDPFEGPSAIALQEVMQVFNLRVCVCGAPNLGFRHARKVRSQVSFLGIPPVGLLTDIFEIWLMTRPSGCQNNLGSICLQFSSNM